MWDRPGPWIKPVSPALTGGFLTTEPPGKSLTSCYTDFQTIFFFSASSSPTFRVTWCFIFLSFSEFWIWICLSLCCSTAVLGFSIHWLLSQLLLIHGLSIFQKFGAVISIPSLPFFFFPFYCQEVFNVPCLTESWRLGFNAHRGTEENTLGPRNMNWNWDPHIKPELSKEWNISERID